jgi:serine/threonine protein kinase
VKLLFTLDLTPEVIRRHVLALHSPPDTHQLRRVLWLRCCTEATILSSVRHINVVNIWGVSVLPPSVCIVLELCPNGSLSDVLRGKIQVHYTAFLMVDVLYLCVSLMACTL